MVENKNITAYRQNLKERIIDTAMEAFAAQGIRAVKMDDVARTLGISKRTLYEIYENKEDLLFEGVKKYRKQKEQDLLIVVSASKSVIDVLLYVYQDTVETFSKTVPQFYTDMVKYPKVMVWLEADRQKQEEHLREFLHRGVQEGYFRKDVDYEIAAGLLNTMGQFIMSNKLYQQYSITQLFQNLVFITLRGLCTLRGVETLDKKLNSVLRR